jgi:hypothetical protein
MKYILVSMFLLPVLSPPENGATDVLKKMYDRYHDKWYGSLTFVQTTERYRNDSLVNTSTWYEAILFPNEFRIDFGNPQHGDAVIYRNDSVFSFQKGQLKKSGAQFNDLTFLLGGMYFIPFDSSLARLRSLHYDLDKSRQDVWRGRPVYVIGAAGKDEKLNQLWIDKEKLVLVRFLKYDDGRKAEGIFDNHIQLSGGWSETSCTFYINDKLIQKEFYKDCKPDVALDPMLFDPASFGKWHWYKGN